MEYDIIIIGAGPAGYVAAIRAGQLGMKTALVEKSQLGGMCLNWGCIPTKALIESAKLYERVKDAKKMGIDGIDPDALSFNLNQAKKRAGAIVKKLTGGVGLLLKKNGVEVINGEALITSANSVSVGNQRLTAHNLIIATGSLPAGDEYPFPAGKFIRIEKLMELESIPEKIVLLGHGPVSVELAQFFRMTGREVHLVSPVEDILPGVDGHLKEFLLKKIKSQGIKLHTSSKPAGVSENTIELNGRKIEYDLVIDCSWRKGVIPENQVGLGLTEDNFIKVDETLQTSVPGVYAAGDVNGLSYLAHAASAQGIFVVNHIKGVKNQMDIKNFPLNIYSVPEISQIGLTMEEIKARGLEYRIGEFPLTANGKALAEDNAEGFIRILSEKKFGEVLGVQIAASNATDLISEAAAFMAVEATVYDVARTIHAHPTISEIFLEAGMDAADQAIHK